MGHKTKFPCSVYWKTLFFEKVLRWCEVKESDYLVIFQRCREIQIHINTHTYICMKTRKSRAVCCKMEKLEQRAATVKQGFEDIHIFKRWEHDRSGRLWKEIKRNFLLMTRIDSVRLLEFMSGTMQGGKNLSWKRGQAPQECEWNPRSDETDTFSTLHAEFSLN